MSPHDDIRERLHAVCDGLSPAQLGRLTGSHPETVRRYLAGDPLPAAFISGLCVGGRLSADWLLCGRGRPFMAGPEPVTGAWSGDLDLVRRLLRQRTRSDLLDALADAPFRPPSADEPWSRHRALFRPRF